MRSLFSVRLALLLVILTLACADTRAQSGSGGLRGFVTERVSAANGIAGARVELRELYVWNDPKAKPDRHIAITDETGNYSFPKVRMGEYTLRVTAEGFEPYEMTLLITSDMSAKLGTLLKKKEAMQRLVESVEIEGNRRIPEDEILSHIKTRPGEPYSAEQVQRDLQSLLNLKVFDTTQTRVSTQAGVRGGVAVIFMVVELPLINEVKFTGLKGVTEANVVEALRERGVKLKTGDVYEQAQSRRAVEVVRELLTARGLSGLSVEIYIENLTPTHVSVEFRITDGRRF